MSSAHENTIEFVGVEFRTRNDNTILQKLNLSVPRGKVMMLLGQSGSGKTTTLRLVNRLEVPTSGEVRVEGVSTLQWDPIRLRRRIGYAIQEVGLFPHYSIEKNVALVPELEGWNKNKVAARVREVMQLAGLRDPEFLRRYPHQLSGGQKQRVGLARALAADPPILLMDEPFGALDPITRVQLQQEFRELQRRLHKTVLFVTHDVGEALMLGDLIAVLESGMLRVLCTPKKFLETKDSVVAAYINSFRTAQGLLAENTQ